MPRNWRQCSSSNRAYRNGGRPEPGSGQATYWNVFNVEGGSSISAQIVTYPALTGMLNDANRTGVFTPNSFGFGPNSVGSGANSLQIAAVPEPGGSALLGTIPLGFGLLQVRQGRS